ncbi:MAG: hypothetical protein RLZZ188_2580 [Verrucomicrobiota bacterium]
MNSGRRTFLRQAVVGAAGVSLAARAAASSSAELPAFDAARPDAYWEAVRALYPLAPDLKYFNTGGLGPAASPVLARAEEVTRRLQSRVEHGHDLLGGARSTLARFLGADPAEISFVRNATEGNSIIAGGLKLSAGDEVIFESHAHPGGWYPWAQQQRLRGVVVRTFEPDHRDPAGNLARIRALCTARTRVVQVSHVTAPTGIVMPVDDIARFCRERGIWCHLDGAQSAGMIPFSLRAIGCDSFATSGHKWLGGPLETGVLYVRRDRLDDVAPVHVGSYSGELDEGTGELRIAGDAMRYEYGTRTPAAALGLAAACELQERIGRERIAVHGRALASRLAEQLAPLPGVEILSPVAGPLAGAMVTFRTGVMPYDVLFKRLFYGHGFRCRPVSEEKLNAVRISAHVFNTPAECDALIATAAAILRQA